MNNNEFYEIGLYEHNANAYRKVREAYEKGENVVGIVHATGTGKTYIAEQLAKDNKDKKILWVVPNNSIVEHIENVIFNNPYLSREVDFKNVEFRTYQSFINMTREELENIDCDLLILDEFHHMGAPVWGSRINTIVDTHPNMKVFGMTAYTVRDRGTPFERDMANPDGGELFSGKIVSRYDLVDAMLDGVLPRDVIYRTSYTNLFGLEAELEDKIQKIKVTKEELEEYKKILATVKKRIAEAPGIEEVVKKYVKANGKYFYFCPPRSEEGTNDINTIMKEAYEWFSSYVPKEDIIFYSTTSGMREEGRHNREMFYNDLTLDGNDAKKKLRVMFAINQYNEGVHAPNVDGVIMGRGTSSDIVYFEQLGRSLAVRGDTYEKYNDYNNYSYDELVTLARDKEISISSGMSKEDIIEKLVSPVIIDLTNNIGFIKELEDNIKHRVRERREKGVGTSTSIKLRDVSFDIDIFNEDLYTTLSSLRNKIYKDWDTMYELAKKYYEYHGNLKIKRIFRTLNGYEHDDNGARLGAWINTQRQAYSQEKLSKERTDKLNKIGMIFSVRHNNWEKMYSLAKKYYDEHDSLGDPDNVVVKDENGEIVNLRNWILTQQNAVIMNTLQSENKLRKLKLIGIDTDNIKLDWNFMFRLAKSYKYHYGNLDIPKDFKTINGYKYNEIGFHLGEWFATEKELIINGEQWESREAKWDELGFNVTAFLGSFDKMMSLASRYYTIYRHLDVPIDFKTNDGVYYEENGYLLGAWLRIQQNVYNQDRLKEDRKFELEKNGMIFENSLDHWIFMYNKAEEYYKKHNNLNIYPNYMTKDGYFLGAWLYHQKHLIGTGKLEDVKVRYLKDIGVVNGFRSGLSRDDWDLMYELAVNYYNKYGTISSAFDDRFVTSDGINHDNDGFNLGVWLVTQKKQLYLEGKLNTEQVDKLREIGISKEKINEQNNTFFEEMYKVAKEFYEKNWHVNPLVIESSKKKLKLRSPEENAMLWWVSDCQAKYRKGQMDEITYKKLKDIGVFMTEREAVWINMFRIASEYYKNYGHLDVPFGFKTFDGIKHDEEGLELRKWIEEQKQLYLEGKLSNEEVDKLREIGISKDKIKKEQDAFFEKKYQIAKSFYEKYGHVNPRVVRSYGAGWDLSPEEEVLLWWVLDCQAKYKKGQIDEDTYKRLKDIGVFMTEREAIWNNMFRLASEYYKNYGHLYIPFEFKTFDGIKHNEDGLELGKWIKNQRINLKRGDRIDKLNSIGMLWAVRSNVKGNQDICLKYGIDYKEHWSTINHMSKIELISKINYLLSIGENIVVDGKLHEIFSMSSVNMEEKYGINLEELINNYYTIDNKKKGL